jgi:hypothetical protein
MNITTRFLVKELKNGLLLDPVNSWDDEYFSEYGYESKEEALKAILNSDCCSLNLVILENVYVTVD